MFLYKPAVNWYTRLINEYPHSNLSLLAIQKIKYIEMFSQYEYIPLSKFEKIKTNDYIMAACDEIKRNEIFKEAENIINEYPDANISPLIYYWLANQTKQHNIEKAIIYYKKLKEKYPQSTYSREIWWEIGELYYNAKYYKKSIIAFNKEKSINPENKVAIDSQIKRSMKRIFRYNLAIFFSSLLLYHSWRASWILDYYYSSR